MPGLDRPVEAAVIIPSGAAVAESVSGLTIVNCTVAS
jgi:hypothetical protein